MNKEINGDYSLKNEDSGYYLYLNERANISIDDVRGFITFIVIGEEANLTSTKPMIGCGVRDVYSLNMKKEAVLSLYVDKDVILIFSASENIFKN